MDGCTGCQDVFEIIRDGTGLKVSIWKSRGLEGKIKDKKRQTRFPCP